MTDNRRTQRVAQLIRAELARILIEEHRIYTEAIALVISGRYRIEGRRVIETGRESR